MFLKSVLLGAYREINRMLFLVWDRIFWGAQIDFVKSEFGLYHGENEHFVGYEQSNLLFCRSLRRFLKSKDHSEDCIVDIGCGKGRMLYFFWQCGFKVSDSLEYSSGLSKIAKITIN